MNAWRHEMKPDELLAKHKVNARRRDAAYSGAVVLDEPEADPKMPSESPLIRFHQCGLLTRTTFFGNIESGNFSERVGSDAPGNGCEQSTLEALRTLPNSPQRASVPPS